MLSVYLKRARELPPHVVLAKAVHLAGRLAARRRLRGRDLRNGSHAGGEPGELQRLLELSAADVPDAVMARLPALCAAYLAHRFDLLGSGPVEMRHGLAAAGVEGHRHPPGPAVEADCDGAWLGERINPANRTASRRLWRLIEGSYAPIDWQIDFKSGYRWDEGAHIHDLDYGRLPGVDVKVPWELARLQHLPQLATAHLLAASGRDGFEDAEVYAREIRNQILDFLATNPPRFGVNWLCPMDVGIRIANMLLAVDMLRAGGWQPDPPFEAALAGAARAHGRHLSTHLEWSAEARSNHYVADLVGLLFCATSLPRDAETDGWIAFAAHQIGTEIAFQFLPDGGNFEGSTNYHRLSTEMALFAAALLLGQAAERAGAFARPLAESAGAALGSGPGRRPPLPDAPVPASPAADGRAVPLPADALARLARAVEACAAWLKPDGRAPQVGDTDSGRLFQLDPAHPLDHRSVPAIGAALLSPSAAPASLEARIATALARGRRLGEPAGTVPPDTLPPQELTAIEKAIRALPEGHRREWRFDLPGFAPDAMERRAFPEFGLYVFRGPASYVALRCVTHAGALEYGHTHDDNLTLELFHGGRDLIADPGSLLYTPAPDIRDAYRAASAHFAPRPAAGSPAATPLAPFALRHDARATCLCFGAEGVAGRLDGPGWTVFRAVRLIDGGIMILDGCPEGPLAEDRTASGDITVSEGYGRRTARPVRLV